MIYVECNGSVLAGFETNEQAQRWVYERKNLEPALHDWPERYNLFESDEDDLADTIYTLGDYDPPEEPIPLEEDLYADEENLAYDDYLGVYLYDDEEDYLYDEYEDPYDLGVERDT